MVGPGACDRRSSGRAADARFAELGYFLAAGAFGNGELLTAERELGLFDAAFPLAPVSPMLGGTILSLLEEFGPAAEAFAQVLATSPGQPDALLHRTRALSFLGDAAAGEASANRLIEVGMWHQGEA